MIPVSNHERPSVDKAPEEDALNEVRRSSVLREYTKSMDNITLAANNRTESYIDEKVLQVRESHVMARSEVQEEKQRKPSSASAKRVIVGSKRRSSALAAQVAVSKWPRTDLDATGADKTSHSRSSSHRSHPSDINETGSIHYIDPLPLTIIQQKLATLKNRTQNYALNILGQLQCNPTGPAIWLSNPPEALRDLYRKVFGDEWRYRTFVLAQSNDFSAYEVLQCLLTASWYLILFEDSRFPSRGPKEVIAALQGLDADMDFVSGINCKQF